MKFADKSQITENPWAEDMKGSNDAFWLGCLRQGFAGALVAATQVANAHGEEIRKREAGSIGPLFSILKISVYTPVKIPTIQIINFGTS